MCYTNCTKILWSWGIIGFAARVAPEKQITELFAAILLFSKPPSVKVKIMVKLIYGVGINDGKHPSTLNGKTSKSYSLWISLLTRCFRPEKRSRTYASCSVSENFKNYSYFHEWCQTQIGFGREGFELDKDLLLKGNKTYSEDTCLFIPSRLNKLLLTSEAIRGSLPLGVSAHGKRFKAQCLREPASPHIGVFNTSEEAFNAYKQVKEAIIKIQAEKWKALIDPRAFAALMAYEVSISD